MNNSTQRIEYIDLAKFIGIFLMVLCHAGMHNMATSVIYAFHMPLFFFLSGYLYNRNNEIKFLPYLRKKAFSILVPYVIFALILCYGTRGILDWGYLFYSSRDSIAEAKSFTPLWFLPCFFVSTMVFFIIDKVTSKNQITFYFFIILIAAIGFFLGEHREMLVWGFPGNIDVAFVCVLVMAVGSSCKFIKICKLGHLFVLGGVLLVMGVVLSLYNLPLSLTEGNPHVELSTSTYGNVFLFLTNLSILCVAVVCLCRVIIECKLLPKRVSNILSFYGANTISVLCFHGIFLIIIRSIVKILGYNMIGFISPLVITITIFLILYPIILFVNVTLPNIVGKKYKK